MSQRQIRQLRRELTDTLRVIAYANSSEAFIRERQQELREKYGALIREEDLHVRGNVENAYLRFMDLLKEDLPLEDIGRTCEDIIYDCLARYR